MKNKQNCWMEVLHFKIVSFSPTWWAQFYPSHPVFAYSRSYENVLLGFIWRVCILPHISRYTINPEPIFGFDFEVQWNISIWKNEPVSLYWKVSSNLFLFSFTLRYFLISHVIFLCDFFSFFHWLFGMFIWFIYVCVWIFQAYFC